MGLEIELRLSTEYIFLCEWKTVYLTWMISLLMQLILGLSSFFLNNKRMLGPYLVSRSFIISAFSHPGQIQIWSKWLSLNVFDSHILAFHYYQKINKKDFDIYIQCHDLCHDKGNYVVGYLCMTILVCLLDYSCMIIYDSCIIVYSSIIIQAYDIILLGRRKNQLLLVFIFYQFIGFLLFLMLQRNWSK